MKSKLKLAFISLGFFILSFNAFADYGSYTWGGPGYTWVGDFNGDHLADIASANYDYIQVDLSNNSGFDNINWATANNWGDSKYSWAGDFNGDGLTDIASANTWDGNVYMNLSTGSGFNSQTWTVSNKWGAADWTWVADFNGDGKTDIASADGGNIYMSLSTGSGFNCTIWTVVNHWGSPQFTWIGDFNGDHLADIASADGGNVYMKLSTGINFSTTTWNVPSSWGTPGRTKVGDFNGDGKTDIASADGGNVYMNLSTGIKFNSQTWRVDNRWGGESYTWVGDFDHNGKTDLASGDGGYVYMNLSNGSGFSSQRWTLPNRWGMPEYSWAADFNGDGLTDIASANDHDVYMHLPRGTGGFWNSVWPDFGKFSLVVMSDPQFNWSCQSENTTTTDYCSIAANRNKDTDTQAQETNNYHINDIKNISNNAMNFLGFVVNGDLTDFGSQYSHLDSFKNAYLNLGFNAWPGLGNHDYANPVNDCGSKGWADYNYCAADMAQFLAGNLWDDNFGFLISKDVTKYKENPGQAGSQRNISGSLGYSWNIGKFHFVQLNNYPSYAVSFKRGYNSGISSWDIDINTSISADGVLADWLKNDLDRAVEEGRNIILNWHRFNDVYNDKIARQNLMVALSPYVNSIKAIFVGHAHGSFGHIDDLVFSNGINIIPVIYSGSAIYSRFVRVDFNSSRVCTINTQVRNTFNQTNTNNSNGNNGQYQINCGAKDSIFQSISKFFRQIFSLKK